jgi:tetratricopeptide (TPR) repeat protein
VSELAPMTFQPQEPFDERGRSPAHQFYEEARRRLDAGLISEATELFLRSANARPHFKTYELLGECYMRQKLYMQAIPYLAAATTLNRGVRAPSLLAETCFEVGKLDWAKEASKIALARDANNKSAKAMKEKLNSISVD